MINKRTGIIAATLILAGCAIMPFAKNGVIHSRFANTISNEEAEEDESEEFAGGFNHLRKMKGDPKTGEIDAVAFYEVARQVENMKNKSLNKVSKSLSWIEMGPDNVGGRTLAILIDKSDKNVLFAGSASGGLWKSKNSGAFWSMVGKDALDNLSVSSIGQTDDGTIYIGTGEQYPGRGNGGDLNSAVLGRGVYSSTDHGATWKHVRDVKNPYTYNLKDGWEIVNKIATKGNDVYAATRQGLWLKKEADADFTQIKTSGATSNKNCMGVYISPDGNTIVAVMMGASQNGGVIIQSTDGGGSWSKLTSSNIPTSFERMEIAFAPSNSQVFYLSVSDNSHKLLGIYQTSDNGKNFSIILKGGNVYLDPFNQAYPGTAAQGDYDNCIAVAPDDENRVFVGGVSFYEGKKIKGTWQWNETASLNENLGSYYIHADKHVITFDTKSSPYIMYVGCDGGIYKSADVSKSTANTTYKEINNGYASVQFYGIFPTYDNIYQAFGGTQDNGTLIVNRTGANHMGGASIHGGDGGYTTTSKIKPNAYFAESQYGSVDRSLGTENFSQLSDKKDIIIPQPGQASWPFVTPFRLWEKLEMDTTTGEYNLYSSIFAIAGYAGVYATRGALAFDKSPLFFRILATGMDPNCMEFTKDGNTLFVGGGSYVYRIDGLKSYKKWAYNKSGNFIPDSFGIKTTVIFTSNGGEVTGIGVDSKDSNHIIITLGSYGTSEHVWESKDAVSSANPSFNSIGLLSKGLPQFPVYDAAIDAADPKHIILGTEYGVWSTEDGGKNWVEDNSGMQRVPVFMVCERSDYTTRSGSVFYIATHGRGFFRAENLSIVGIEDGKQNKVATQLSVFPNPAKDFTNIKLELAKNAKVSISVFDINGRIIETKDANLPQGNKDFNINTTTYKAGTYIVRAVVDGEIRTSKFIVNR
ncbi:MAG: T9SS type A sorting domain-containing protein [Bacteroidetes bacterium]|nr:T9SS type A sorting domain-containing protein [Bacteroidota bacterium]